MHFRSYPSAQIIDHGHGTMHTAATILQCCVSCPQLKKFALLRREVAILPEVIKFRNRIVSNFHTVASALAPADSQFTND